MAATLALGASPAATLFGERLGAALRLVEIVDGFARDSHNGFLALPLDWLDDAGVAVASLQERRGGPELHAALTRLAAQAGSHVDAALAAVPRAARGTLSGQLALAAGYTRRLADWRRGGFDVFGAAPPERPLAMLWRCWRAARRLEVER
jgi:phytoene/squalene synthetase